MLISFGIGLFVGANLGLIFFALLVNGKNN